MPRSLTPAAIGAAQATTSADVFLALLTIQITEAEVWRLVADTQARTSRGQVYTAWPFEVVLPDEAETMPSSIKIRLDNVDPRLWSLPRQLGVMLAVKLEVVLAREPDAVLLTVDNLRMRVATATSTLIEAELFSEAIWQLGYPAHDYTAAEYPGLFAVG